MTMPEFTADASLQSSNSKYTGLSSTFSRLATSPVTAQVVTLGPDYWAWNADQHFFCLPPWCGRDHNGICHCLTAVVDINAPKSGPGVQR